MDLTNAPSRQHDVVEASTGLKRPTGVSGRRRLTVAATVLVVLSLAAWAVTGFYGDRPSALPRTGDPMPTSPIVGVDPGLQEELALITTALTRRYVDDEMLIEAVYSTPELFTALSRREAALQRDRESEQLRQTYQRDHELDRYLVFTLILGSDISGLEEYRPEAKSYLRTASSREVTAESWVEIPSLIPDHHRIGMLHFPRFTVDGQSLLSENDSWLELVLSAPDGRERVLRWELPIAYPTVPTTQEKG